jgi:hypothetical protein
MTTAITAETQTILDEINSRMGTHMGTIAIAQAGYFATHGHYAQGLLTHSAPPADGEVVPADRLTDHPTDQPYSWADLATTYGLTFPSQPQAAVRVDTYNGPAGQGYVIVVMVEINEVLYQRDINIGPLAERTQAWRAMDG